MGVVHELRKGLQDAILVLACLALSFALLMWFHH